MFAVSAVILLSSVFFVIRAEADSAVPLRGGLLTPIQGNSPRQPVPEEAGWTNMDPSAGPSPRILRGIDSQAVWPPDTVPIDVVLIGFDLAPTDLLSLLTASYDVTTPVASTLSSPFNIQLEFNVASASESYHQAFLDYLQSKAVYADSLQARLNLGALIDQRDNGTLRDIFDPLVGWEIRSEWAELYLEQLPAIPTTNPAGYTFYLMNLSALDNPATGIDHWFVKPSVDPDTMVTQDWWRLEWDNDLNTPMGYPLNAWGGPGRRVFIDPTAYQWYLDWAHVWWEGGAGPAPFGLQYEEVPLTSRVDYLAGVVNDLVEGLSATPLLPDDPVLAGPPQEPSILLRNYVLSGSLNHSLDDLRWIVSDVALESYLEGFLPFKEWEMNTTFALLGEYPELLAVVDASTTFDGDRGFIDGVAVWLYLLDNTEIYVPDDSGVFEVLSVNFLYDNRSFVFSGREFTGLGGDGVTAIYLKTDRLFYADGTRQKGLTSIISHETGHNLGYNHQFGPNWRADFIDGNMGYFVNGLEYGRFWEDALHRVTLRAKLLGVQALLDVREPLNLTPEFATFYRHYGELSFLQAYDDLATIEAMLRDTQPPTADAGVDLGVDEDAPVRLDGSGSRDNFRILNYTWDFGDGTNLTSPEPTVEKVWEDPGVYTVSLTVFDAAGNSATDTLIATVLDVTPPPNLVVPLVIGAVILVAVAVSLTAGFLIYRQLRRRRASEETRPPPPE